MAEIPEDDFLAGMSPEVRNLHGSVRGLIADLGHHVKMRVVGDYIAFSVTGVPFARIPARVTRLSLFLHAGRLGVERGECKKVHGVVVTRNWKRDHRDPCDALVHVTRDTDLAGIAKLLRLAYDAAAGQSR